MAPSGFGQFSNDLLVANQGNGQVDAFNPTTGQFLGAFADDTGAPIVEQRAARAVLRPGGHALFHRGAPMAEPTASSAACRPRRSRSIIEPATLSASITNVTAFVDQPFNGVVATFTDANIYALPGDFTATVEWGDGSPPTPPATAT